jgi:hypothetical protein
MNLDLTRFGPFAAIVAIALALVAMFATLLLKMFGNVSRWTWLSSGAPSFLVSAAPRALAVALMAVTYVTISKSNYLWFAAMALLCGIVAFVTIAQFDRLRERHVVRIPEVGPDGKQLMRGTKPVERSIVVGLEEDIRTTAKPAWTQAQEKTPGLSIVNFMSGFGVPPYNPEAVWDRILLADIRNKLTVKLMLILLYGVMVLYISAFIVEVFRTA